MALVFKVDTVQMVFPPSGVAFRPLEGVVYPTAGGGNIVHHPLNPGAVEARWGMEAARVGWVVELETMRGGNPRHSVTFSDAAGTGEVTYDVYIPEVKWERADPNPRALAATTLVMPILASSIYDTFFLTPAAPTVNPTTAGSIISISAFLRTAGSTATAVQVTNGGNYLSTPGTIPAGDHLMTGHVLTATPTFAALGAITLDETLGTGAAGLTVVVKVRRDLP